MIIYKATNLINGKIYIGQTVRTLEVRIRDHKRSKSSLLGKAINKYGEENFKIEVIDEAEDISSLNEKEYYWVKFYDCIAPNGYNQCEGGGNTTGYHHKENSKEKMSEHHKGLASGERNPFYGKHHSEETRKRWSQQRSGRTLSQEWRENIGKSQWKKVINLDTGEVFNSIKEAGEKYGCDPTHITRVCKGKRNRTRGYRFAYYNDDNTVPSHE